ncbi:hypothetical protein [Tessaracoccus antarcticus]|nr:hypothetical protein [Tessaracoccus antarcticus]
MGGPPLSVLHTLTKRSQALTPALQELEAWAQENLTAERRLGDY